MPIFRDFLNFVQGHSPLRKGYESNFFAKISQFAGNSPTRKPICQFFSSFGLFRPVLHEQMSKNFQFVNFVQSHRSEKWHQKPHLNCKSRALGGGIMTHRSKLHPIKIHRLIRTATDSKTDSAKNTSPDLTIWSKFAKMSETCASLQIDKNKLSIQFLLQTVAHGRLINDLKRFLPNSEGGFS